jgi:hypothetical protein
MYEWVWIIGGMILTGETEVLGEKHYTAMVVDVWMSMDHWWNDTDRGNWSTGRETLYSVGGRWMSEYGASVEWYWQGKSEVLGETNVLVTLRPPQISHRLTWDQTRNYVMSWSPCKQRPTICVAYSQLGWWRCRQLTLRNAQHLHECLMRGSWLDLTYYPATCTHKLSAQSRLTLCCTSRVQIRHVACGFC